MRKHDAESSNGPQFEVKGEIEILNKASDTDVEAHLAAMGMPEAVMEQAMAAAQKVFVDSGINVSVSELSVEEHMPGMLAGCRCVARVCEPYQRCWNENGQRVCVRGHRQRCTRYVCT